MSTHCAILFISGAGLPAWIWDDVRPVLGGSDRVRVAARPVALSRARLRDYAQAALDSAPPGRFVIVAHSSGGVIGAELVRLAPHRVSAVLAVSAVIPPPGGSFLSCSPAPNRWILGTVMRFAGTRPPDAGIRRGLAHGLDERITERLIADFVPESPGLYRDNTDHRFRNVPRGYVFTERDRGLPIARQRQSARRLGGDWTDHLDAGHLPMIENPTALTASITGFLTANRDPIQTSGVDTDQA